MAVRGRFAVWLGRHNAKSGNPSISHACRIRPPGMHRSEAMTTRAVAEALDQALARLMVDEAPLAARLEQYASTLRELNQPFAEAADRLISRLSLVKAGGEAPQLGEPLQPFLLPDETGHFT